MHPFISNPFVIFRTQEEATKLAAENQATDDSAEYRVIEVNDGRFVVAVFEDGEFVMNL
jgi:hypothetical protein